MKNEKILNGKLHFLSSVDTASQVLQSTIKYVIYGAKLAFLQEQHLRDSNTLEHTTFNE